MTIQSEAFPVLSTSDTGAAVSRETQERLVVVIPAYNEALGIKKVVDESRLVLESMGHEYSIIVVDDGSVDGTRQVIDGLDVERFFHRKNMGKGDVIKNVLEFIEPSEVVILLDGDGEHEPADMARLVHPVLHGRASVIIGSRFLKTNGASDGNVENGGANGYLARTKRMKFFKNFGNRLFTFLVWIFTGQRITDSLSGYRVFKASTIQSLGLCAEGFRIEMEMTVKAIKAGLVVLELPVRNGLPRRHSHLNTMTDGTRIALTVLREFLPPLFSSFFDWLLPRVPRKLGRFFA